MSKVEHQSVLITTVINTNIVNKLVSTLINIDCNEFSNIIRIF